MDIENTHNQLYTALRTLVLLDVPLLERLQDGFVRSMFLEINEKDVPEEHRAVFKDIYAFLQNMEGKESKDQVGECAEKILNFYSDLLMYMGEHNIRF